MNSCCRVMCVCVVESSRLGFGFVFQLHATKSPPSQKFNLSGKLRRSPVAFHIAFPT